MNDSLSIAVTTISKENNYLTLINMFTVKPDDQQKLIGLLISATQIVKKQPGFISSSLHRSLDGGKVTMYAQWESLDHYNHMRGNPEGCTIFATGHGNCQFRARHVRCGGDIYTKIISY